MCLIQNLTGYCLENKLLCTCRPEQRSLTPSCSRLAPAILILGARTKTPKAGHAAALCQPLDSCGNDWWRISFPFGSRCFQELPFSPGRCAMGEQQWAVRQVQQRFLDNEFTAFQARPMVGSPLCPTGDPHPCSVRTAASRAQSPRNKAKPPAQEAQPREKHR